MDGTKDVLQELEDWAREQSDLFRSEGFAAHQRGATAHEHTYIGREWAFLSVVFKCRELRGEIEAELEKLFPYTPDPRD